MKLNDWHFLCLDVKPGSRSISELGCAKWIIVFKRRDARVLPNFDRDGRKLKILFDQFETYFSLFDRLKLRPSQAKNFV